MGVVTKYAQPKLMEVSLESPVTEGGIVFIAAPSSLHRDRVFLYARDGGLDRPKGTVFTPEDVREFAHELIKLSWEVQG